MTTPSTADPAAFVAALRGHARTRPDRTAVTFADYSTERAGVRTSLTYRQFDELARHTAARLRAVTRPGDRVAVLCPQGPEYLVGVIACLYAGTLAVPLYAPELYRSSRRLETVMADCGATAALTTPGLEGVITGLLGEDTATGRKTDVIAVAPGHGAPAPELPAELPEIAYLQYTSGSTRNPAGVQVTHRNISVGVRQLAGAFGMDEHSVLVSWLPFFHDMGLVLTALTPLYLGASTVYMSPYAFVQNPLRWLRLVTEYRATHLASPNFGLDLCVDRLSPEQRAELDLSAVTALINGAEPVRAATLRRFSDAFAPAGFRHEAHLPAYGLAETTLIVTGTEVGRGPLAPSFDRRLLEQGTASVAPEGPESQQIVSCGLPADQEVRIVDAATRTALPEGGVGSVWVRGANVCTGYWRRPEETAETFAGRIEGEPGGPHDGWLDTGDLGFLRDGELYIAGRAKDIVIVDGRNHYPADVELTAEAATPALRRGHVLAFGITEDDTEKLVVVAEVDRRHAAEIDEAAVVRAVRAAISDAHEVETHAVVLVRYGTAPKTTSGKLQRRLCRQQYLTGALTAFTA